MLGITTMKLYQEFIRQPTPENQELLENSKELLIVGMSATGKTLLLAFFASLLCYCLVSIGE